MNRTVVATTEYYDVTARRWEHGWELHIADAQGEEIGVTQSRSLSGADRMIRDYLAMDDRDVDASVILSPELDPESEKEIAEARAEQVEAEEKQAAAAQKSRAVVRRLRSAGLSGPDIAKVLHLSTQRVSQLSSAARE